MKTEHWKRYITSVMDRPFIKVDQLPPHLTQQLLNNYQELYALGKDGETEICRMILQPLFNYMKRCYGEEFNSVVVNIYDDKDKKIPYNKDYDATVPDDSVIAIVTLNEVSTDAQTLRFKSECNNVHIETTSGSVVLFNKKANRLYLHGTLNDTNIVGSRISVTFRRFDEHLVKRQAP